MLLATRLRDGRALPFAVVAVRIPDFRFVPTTDSDEGLLSPDRRRLILI